MEQIKYKSSLINAGIIKARETWTHPMLDKTIGNITTEEIPFLNTPKAHPTVPRFVNYVNDNIITVHS